MSLNSTPDASAQRRVLARNVWVDTFVLLGLFAAVNFLLSPNDFGWTQANPSPFLTLPILVGGLYGSAAGIGAGIAAGAAVLLGQFISAGADPRSLLAAHPFFFGCLPVFGAICGEIQSSFRRRLLQLQGLNEHLVGRLKRLDADFFFLRESKNELERALASRNAEFSTLDSEVRRLMESDEDELYPRVLLLLNRQTRASNLGLYLLGTDHQLLRKAVLGSPAGLPESMPASQIDMVQAALEQKRTVSIPEFWNSSSAEEQPYLAVVPLLDSGEKMLGVVIVTEIPFIALHHRTLRLMALICRWAARVIEVSAQSADSFRIVGGVDTQRVYTVEAFRCALDLSVNSQRTHNLPSSAILLSIPGGSLALQPELEQAILPAARAGDYPADLGLPMPHLAILLPLTGERGAQLCIQRIRECVHNFPAFAGKLEARLFAFKANQQTDDIWRDLLGGDGSLA